MNYLNSSKFRPADFKAETFHLKIEPFEYLDGRKPRLPRKSSKKYELRTDTKFYFDCVFKHIDTIHQAAKFKVEINVFTGNDRLGHADLDNYCKAILDGVTATKKIWVDDRHVDEIFIRRTYTNNQSSYITLKIQSLKT